jgi:ubiquitin-conjugating enzyme E2 J1
MEDNATPNIPPPAPPETIRAGQYNMRSPSVKRILAEARELASKNEDFIAQPLEENIYEWHFTFRGAPDTDFEVGIYHGRIILPADYPMNPPAFIMMTPNGRFEVGKKICLSISSYHPETWRPCWSIRTAIAALVAFMNTSSPGAIGSLECSSEQRKAFAKKSLHFVCPHCGPCGEMIKYSRNNPSTDDTAAAALAKELPPPTAPPRIFRLPRSSQEVIVDPLVTPEEIVATQGIEEPVFMTHDNSGDTNGEFEEMVNWQIANGIRAPNGEFIVQGANAGGWNDTAFILSVAVLVAAITGLVLRRAFWDFWYQSFGGN